MEERRFWRGNALKLGLVRIEVKNGATNLKIKIYWVQVSIDIWIPILFLSTNCHLDFVMTQLIHFFFSLVILIYLDFLPYFNPINL